MPNSNTPTLKKPNSSATEIKQVLTNAKNILINMDTRFDFDAVCSALAFEYILINHFKKQSTIIYCSKLNDDAQKLLNTASIVVNTDISQIDLEDYDLIIALDSGDSKHISIKPGFTTPRGILVMNIDHHLSNDYFGTFNYVNYLASNTSNIYKLLNELEIEIDMYLGRLITLGLLTDSGFFMYDTVTAYDFRVAGDMKELGVDFDELIYVLTSNEPIDNLRLKELVISNLKLPVGKNYAYSTVTLLEIAEKGIDESKAFATPSDIIRRLDSVDFVFVIIEKTPNNFKVSFRSHNPKFEVSALAKKLNGGGHFGAASAPIPLDYKDLDSAVTFVLAEIESYLSTTNQNRASN